MKKEKNILGENKVLLMLITIVVLCIIVVVIVSITFFYGGGDNAYGNRLDSIKDMKITDSQKNDIKSTLKENESVEDVSVSVKGAVVYISIKYVDNTKMDDAKKIAATAVDLFTEDELLEYDIVFTISSNKDESVEDKKNEYTTYTLMGSKNANGSAGVIWSNYTIKEESNE